MAGLPSSMTSNVGTTEVTLPGWYDTAQQNAVTQAGQAAPPALGTTAGQTAVNNLSPNSTTNPFTGANSILSAIGAGAVNPWVTGTDASGNATTTGNPNTAMGGLFNAQTSFLNQIMPNITATPEAANIGTGNFGSLRGQTAVDKAKADAMANLFAQQNQAALQNQQTGVSAGTGMGSVGAQGTQAELNTGTYQQTEPFMAPAAYANIISSVRPGTTTTQKVDPSILNQVGALGSMSSGLLNSLLDNGDEKGLLSRIGNLFS